jgi:hypothetical protein
MQTDRTGARAPGDTLASAERWLALLHRAAMTALALVSLWLILR